MGQAKKRGSFEDRLKAAQERDAILEQKRIEREEQRRIAQAQWDRDHPKEARKTRENMALLTGLMSMAIRHRHC